MLPPITDSIQDSIGSTPMVKLTPQNKGKLVSALDIWLQDWPTWPVCHVIQSVNILAKLEYMNPTGSAKDRLAKYLLDGR